MATFDIGEFHEVVGDIETYLGYLKANELANDYLHEAVMATTGTPPDSGDQILLMFLEDDYKYPCPDGRFSVTPNRGFFNFQVHSPGSGEPGSVKTPTEYIQELQRGADESYRNGLAWASGLQSHLISICNQIVKPDVFALNAAANTMRSSVVSELGNLTAIDWAGIEGLLSNWHGDAKLAFDQYYRGVSSQLYDFTRFTAYACKATYAATRIINGTQNGLIQYVKHARDAIVDQLNEWADRGYPPEDPPKTPQWVAKVEEIAKDGYVLLDYVPVVKDVKGQVDSAVQIVSSIEAIAIDLGWDPPHDEPPFDAKDSDELYTEITTKLRQDYYDKYVAAMETQAHGEPQSSPGAEQPVSADQVLGELRERMSGYGWDLPEVGGGSLIATQDGDHDTNHDGVDDGSIYRA